MRGRLRALGIGGAGRGGVQALTFHAAALRQLRYFGPRVLGGPVPELLDNKIRLVAAAAARAGVRDTNRTVLRDLAAEVEWAKVSLCPPERYVAAGGRGRPGAAGAGRHGGRGDGGVRGGEGAGRRPRLRGPAAGHRGRHRGAPGRRRGAAGPLPALRGRRVPGRQPAAAAAAGRLARRSRRPVRGRRPQPDDLLLHRRHPGVPAGLPAPLPRRRRWSSWSGTTGPPRRWSSWPTGCSAGASTLRLVGQRPAGPEATFAEYDDEPAEAAAVAGVLPGRDGRRHPGERARRAVPGQRAVGGVRAGAGRRRRAVRAARRGALLRPDGDPGGGAAAARGGPVRRVRGQAGRPGPGRAVRDGLVTRRAARRRRRPGALGVARRAGRRWPRSSPRCSPRPGWATSSPSWSSGPPHSTRRPCRASRSRRCTRPRGWSGTRSSWSGWWRAPCRSSTRSPTSRSTRSGGCSTSG